MDTRIFASADRACRAAARLIARQLEDCPDSVLGLPTGRTVAPVYDFLAKLHPDCSRVHTFNLDEFVGVSPQHPGSFRTFMEQHLFTKVNLSTRRVHLLDGTAPDLDAECLRFERDIAAAGGIDLLVLGIGVNGHIGFNEPGRELKARTHRTPLRPATRRANASLFGGRASNVPHEALSMGIGTILSARTIALIATGPSKACAIRRLVRGDVTTTVPATFLQLHPRVQLILDKEAAARL
jgi:glucosamine-6-phosphate deaminase